MINMEIISVSIDQETLTELDNIKEKLGFKSRSKLLRATINSLLNEYKVVDTLNGHSDSVITITYDESNKNRVSSITHSFHDAIKTTVHQHHQGVCIEILMVCCDAARTKKLFSELKKDKGVLSIHCSVL